MFIKNRNLVQLILNNINERSIEREILHIKLYKLIN